MRLADLLEGLELIRVEGNPDTEIDSIVYDSRKARRGSLFVCIQGYVTDGHAFIRQAIEQQVSAIMVARPDPHLSGTWVQVTDTRFGLAHVADRFYHHPSGQLDLIGITGTKGKTTAAYMTRAILQAAGKQTGLIGTVASIVGNSVRLAARTTPESYDLQTLLDEMVRTGLDSCVMEVSSQGLMLGRVHGCDYRIGAFTNLYHDHIGPQEHASMEDYLAAKLMLFKQSEAAVINRDIDCYEQVRAAAPPICLTYGLQPDTDVRAVNMVRMTEDGRVGTRFDVLTPWGSRSVFVGMPGLFNVYNALTAIACTGMLGIGLDAMASGLADITVPGRLQAVPGEQPYQVLVDYAHNAASLESLLSTLREYTEGRLIVVFGCGGDRARSRRFEMGEVAGRLADLTVITSDNPRTEDPAAIIDDIITGIRPTGGHYCREIDRAAAIRLAIQSAGAGDMIVIAGKGHENYQIFSDRTIHFDDAEVADRILREEEARHG